MEGIVVRADELNFSFVRSQGAGGQHVNKTSTAVQLKFDSQHSEFPDWAKQQILLFSDDRISKTGVIQIKAQNQRSQELNKQDAINRLLQLLQQALHRPKTRKATRPTLASKIKRLDHKKIQQQRKLSRSKFRLQEG